MSRKNILPGGLKSILYSLSVAHRVGFKNHLQSIFSKNTCKTCALGMGGQKGGMRNESGDFPEICKKSIQAQLTDIQKEIPATIFSELSIEDLKKLPPRRLERLGRLGQPLFKEKDGEHFSLLSWPEAYKRIIRTFKNTTPAEAFFYSSGRSSMEAAFALQLFARLFGTNNVNNCSYYCHQASGVGMNALVGTGTATLQLKDLDNADLIFVVGANPASNHPRFMTRLADCRKRGGQVIIINPAKEPGLVRFSVPSRISSLFFGGSSIASLYAQPHLGGDIALMKGIAKAVLENNSSDPEFTENYTLGFASFEQDIKKMTWEEICENSGVSKEVIAHIARLYGASQRVVFSWAMGITQHDHGVDNVESIVNLALLRGMVGKKDAGLLPLRGHSNVQGVGSVGVMPELKPEIFKSIEAQLNIRLPQLKGADTMASMKLAYEQKVKAAFFLGGNLYASNPDSGFAEKALSRIPFKLFLSTTLNQGHLFGSKGEVMILPVLTRDEEPAPSTQESMFNFVRLSEGGICRLPAARSELDIICDIAASLIGPPTFNFKSLKQRNKVRELIARTVPGFKKLESIDNVGGEFQVENRTLHQPKFSTETGKASFSIVPIPPLKGGSRQFRLTSVRSEGQFNSIIYDEEDLFRGQKSRWIVMISPCDIERLGMKENQKVDLVTATGEMRDVAVRAFDIRSGNLMVYYPEGNVIIPKDIDPRSKTPSFKSVAVTVKI